MAVVTVSTLIDAVRKLADIQNAPNFITDDEIVRYINTSATEFVDVLIDAYESYYVKFYQFTLQPGQSSSAVPTDFYKMDCLQIQLPQTPTGWQTLTPIPFSEVGKLAASRLVYQLYTAPNFRYTLAGTPPTIYFWPPNQSQGHTYQLIYYPQYSPMAVGTEATGTIADISYTAQTNGSAGNAINITYVGGGTAGAESVTLAPDNVTVTVTIANGASTAAQVASAVNNSPVVSNIVLGEITGEQYNPQTVQGPTYLGGGIDDGTIDGINGWEQYIQLDAAIQCKIKQQKDTTELMQRKADMLTRIAQHMANKRDASGTSIIPEPRNDVGLGGFLDGFDYGGLW